MWKFEWLWLNHAITSNSIRMKLGKDIVRHCKTFIFTKFPSQNNIIIKIALQLEGVYIQKKMKTIWNMSNFMTIKKMTLNNLLKYTYDYIVDRFCSVNVSDLGLL